MRAVFVVLLPIACLFGQGCASQPSNPKGDEYLNGFQEGFTFSREHGALASHRFESDVSAEYASGFRDARASARRVLDIGMKYNPDELFWPHHDVPELDGTPAEDADRYLAGFYDGVGLAEGCGADAWLVEVSWGVWGRDIPLRYMEGIAEGSEAVDFVFDIGKLQRRSR